MTDFDLYYWPVPFRGQFIRAVLAYAGQDWSEHDPEAIDDLMGKAPGEQPVAFMGPPVLVDRRAGFAISQMAAIACYLGDRFDLQPATPQGRAMTAKIANDANDVIDELTQQGGRDMWTAESWAAFLPRLRHWMLIFEDLAERNGVTADSGCILGTDAPGTADIITATLWSTMGDRFPVLARMCEETAPRIWALCLRMQATPPLLRLKEDSFRRYGNAYCGGQIEASLRKVAV